MDLFDLDPDRSHRTNKTDDRWWDQLIADSPLWSSDGSLARDEYSIGHFPIVEPEMRGSESPGNGSCDGDVADAQNDEATDDCAASARSGDAGRDKGRSSWVLVGSLRESAQALALAALPDDVDVCLAEAEELLFARDRMTCALAERVGRVHGAGQAKRHGHASTRSWLRTAGGMSVAGAGRLITLAVELARLPRVREKFAAGGLAAGVVEAICTATAQLSDEHAGLAEPILLELAGKAGAAEVAKAGRYLRAVLDPDGEERDERADFGRRFLRVRPTPGGGVEGEFYLPREAAARLRALLDAYAKPRAEGDDRPLRVRNADAFIALLEQKVAAELLVLVTAESLPTDPQPNHPADPNDTEDTGDYAPSDAGNTDDPSEAEATGGCAPSDAGNTGGPGDLGTAADPGCVETEAAAGSAADAGADAAADAVAESTGPRDGGSRDPGAEEHEAGERETFVHGADERGLDGRGVREQRASEHDTASAALAEGDGDTITASAEGDDTAPAKCGDRDRGAAQAEADPRRAAAWPTCGGSTPPHAARLPDPPPGDASAHHAHAGHRPAGDCRHGQSTPEDHRHEHRRDGKSEGEDGCGGEARCSCATGTLGTAPGTPPGVPGPEPGRPAGTAPVTEPGAVLGTAPGVLLATGQMLPVSSVHRLARTSTLVRLVMDAEGQVLDMGRKVRLATPAQRRAVYARYATCWIDGCPLPATMCQIDHADNWSNAGLTDLKLLGPACQFHNRDRYQHPDRYTRHKISTDRWAFTYQPTYTRRLRV